MNSMPKYRPLGDYVALQRGTTYQGSKLGEPGPFLLGLASIARNGGFKSDNLKTYGGISDPRILLLPGDIYVSLKDVTQSGDLLGAIARVPDFIHQGRLTQDTVKLAFKNQEVSKDYIYWLLRTQNFREYCRAHATGTTNLGLARDDFLAFPVPEPTPTRMAITTMLQALDDKIRLNRRMNETLDAMARALYSKASAHPLWETTVGELAEIFDGPHATPNKTSQGPIFLGISDLANGYIEFSNLARVSEDDFVRWTRRVTPRTGDVVFSYETRLGECARIPPNFHCCLGRRMGLLRPREGRTYSEVLLYAFLSTEFQETIRLRTVHGSTVDRIPLTELGTFPIAVPSIEQQTRLVAILSPLRRRAEHNQSESQTLAALSDLLLPKLMSGDIRVKDAETLVGQAA